MAKHPAPKRRTRVEDRPAHEIPAGPRTNLYREITDRISGELEAGRVPWVQPWGRPGGAGIGLPRNASTGRAYSGINILLLWGAVARAGYAGQSWLTFRQALALGGSVRKGERGTTVVYADRFTPEDEQRRAKLDGDVPRGIPFLKRFTVFNTEQCEGLPEDSASNASPSLECLVLPRVEQLIRASGADLRIGGDRACYDLRSDLIRVPPPQAFHEPIDWHRTALHELGHWSGAANRLGRDLSGTFGSKRYAQEELVAEMTAAFACAALAIRPTVRHADYIGSWLDVLREDDRAIVRAASAASKASDFLLSFAPAPEGPAADAADREIAR